MRVSVLDQSPISAGMTGAQALHNSVDLARRADALGFHRFWVAEHHGSPMLAGASPEVLLGPIGAATSRIRLGSGGVMLPHYSPLKVAESFSMLSGLFPGRVDLAVGRAPGTDPRTTLALQRDRTRPMRDDFPDQLAELLAYVRGALPPGHPFARLPAMLPGRPEHPAPWLLGSSAQSGIWAAELGLPYAFADFINPVGAEVARRYRAEFVPSEFASTPYTIVCAWVVCAETDDEAERLAASGRMTLALLLRGELIPVPPVDEALAFLEAERAREAASPFAGLPQARLAPARRRIVGAPDTVARDIGVLARDYEADEVMVVTITYDHAARVRSYELLAEAFGLAD
ncbi:luciferase family oxidoreductase, group 1 (plasmid) [Gemmatirosa kalamazoonensis]|uniref:Luciferase-like monooxygenase n=1 Tax=Gemmatirosa kalamazoonensis TaxID=861299 RepID=W0RQ74_9BACT|nr:LLM class flavin-dependent oxidoreductase [Gemmatirosa kalamazoonensis]AHG92490.1 luciferase family oxidoreductase, group 1 [Gemmatirosa kalamazoonensis]